MADELGKKKKTPLPSYLEVGQTGQAKLKLSHHYVLPDTMKRENMAFSDQSKTLRESS